MGRPLADPTAREEQETGRLPSVLRSPEIRIAVHRTHGRGRRLRPRRTCPLTARRLRVLSTTTALSAGAIFERRGTTAHRTRPMGGPIQERAPRPGDAPGPPGSVFQTTAANAGPKAVRDTSEDARCSPPHRGPPKEADSDASSAHRSTGDRARPAASNPPSRGRLASPAPGPSPERAFAQRAVDPLKPCPPHRRVPSGSVRTIRSAAGRMSRRLPSPTPCDPPRIGETRRAGAHPRAVRRPVTTPPLFSHRPRAPWRMDASW